MFSPLCYNCSTPVSITRVVNTWIYYFLWTCNHKTFIKTLLWWDTLLRTMFSGHGYLSPMPNEPLFSFQWMLCFAQVKSTSRAFRFLWASVLLFIPSEILFYFFSPGYPSGHLPNYIFSFRSFRYQLNTFLLWEEPITLSLGLKTSVCSHPLYRNYCSIFRLVFLHPRHGFVFPWHLKRFSIISFLV